MFLVAFCLLCSVMPPASASVFDDIKALAAAARDRATQARDRAIQARDRAADARDSANEVRDEIEDAKARVSSDVAELAEEAVEDLQRVILESLEGREAFVADGGCSLALCEPFRQDLMTLFQKMQDVQNSMYGIAGLDNVQADFQRIIDLVQDVPGRALFPVYRVMKERTNVFEAGLLDQLSDTADSLQVIREAMARLRSGDAMRGDGEKSPLDLEIQACQWWDENLEGLQEANQKVVFLAMILDGLGGICQALAWYLPSNPEINTGAGFLNIWFKWSILEMPAEILGGLAQTLFMADNFISDQTQHCTQIIATGDVRDVLVEVHDDLSARQAAIRQVQDDILALQEQTLLLVGGAGARGNGGVR